MCLSDAALRVRHHESRDEWAQVPERRLESPLRKLYPSRGLWVSPTRHLVEVSSRKVSLEVIKRIERPAEPRQSYNTDALYKSSVPVRCQAYVKVPNACSKPGRIPSNRVDSCISIPSASQNEGDKVFSGEVL